MAFLHGNVRTCASDLVSHSFVCLLSAVCCQSFSLPLFSFLTFPALSLSLSAEKKNALVLLEVATCIGISLLQVSKKRSS